jgi:hypothetical protein
MIRKYAEYSLGLKGEAAMLSRRLGIKASTIESWMRYEGISSILELKDRYKGGSHAECMERAAGDIETFIFNS